MNNGNTLETTYYVYNVDGQQARKVTERQMVAGQIPIKLKEKIYVGLFKIYYKFGGDGSTTLEREILSIINDKKWVVIIKTWTLEDNSGGLPARLVCTQFANHLYTSMLKLDGDG